MMRHQNYIQIGEIYREHGIRGEVKVYIYSHSSENFQEGQEIILERSDGEELKTKILNAESYKQWFLTRFSAFKNPEEVREWRKAGIFVDKAHLTEAGEGEHYLFELIGFNVEDQEGNQVGTLKGMMGEGESALYVVHDEQEKEILIPAVREWVLKIDKENKKIVVKVLEGLI